ncbi:MAG: nitrogenase-stabilizing/protective protein NifW [Helicobacteraceae bacterium]|jgi:nitrogenase-stabilizing/protective protein|nr:nitrogenase-stabilizing/protective protein NifW [Helicobacteraceae bacterium]
MKTLAAFNKLASIDGYLGFFEIKADDRIVSNKRLHILKLFGDSIKKIKTLEIADENRLLDIYRFALLTIVKRFEDGFSPSAAEIWNALEKPSACFSCASSISCASQQSECEVKI